MHVCWNKENNLAPECEISVLHLTEPDWASQKLGVFVCLTCSGIHRSLFSQVKSIKLDFWEDEWVEVGAAFFPPVIFAVITC